jgi:hypothetical protein
MKIAVGFLVAYDYPLLKHALPQVYADADCIVLGLDKDCRSFSGNPFEVSPEFFEWVKAMDIAEKIIWHRGDFFQPHLRPLEVETFTRNRVFSVLPEKMDWYIQLDSDEYFIDFKGFREWLDAFEQKDINAIKVHLKSMYKQAKNGYFNVGSLTESVVIACRTPVYHSTRHPVAEKHVFAPFVLLHQSWARGDGEVQFKLSNWGHKNDMSAATFYKLWSACNRFTYRFYRHFHPLHPPLWPFLEYIPANNMASLIDHYQQHLPAKTPTPTLPVWFRPFRKVFFP